jgi:adenine specific DNA methylase Mod
MEEYKQTRSLEKINALLNDSIIKLRSLRDQLDFKPEKKAVKMQILLFQVTNNLLKIQRLLEGIMEKPPSKVPTSGTSHEELHLHS